MAHLGKNERNDGFNDDDFDHGDDQDQDDERDSNYDDDFEQEEVLGDDHDIYGFEDEGMDD